jgi:beta-glucanase (GH16 family)/cbb3-type cytochrome oxidase subunit 3
MLFSLKPAIAAAALLLPALVSAQVTTDCNPLEKDCPPNPAFATEQNFNFNATPNSALWEKTAGYPKYDADKGAILQITKQGESTTLQMKYYFHFGRTEMHMKASHGTGIISSMMWISDCLDEVDWEMLGSKPTLALSNYFGKGDQDSAVGKDHEVGVNVVEDYHNYTTVWTKDRLEWWFDGKLQRTLLPADAVINGTSHYPQTPMRVRLGIWAGGDPNFPEGTRQWAGGDTKYEEEGPFYMYVKSIQIADYSSGKEYVYSDRSGDWSSIEAVEGKSKAVEEIEKPPPEPTKSMSEKFSSLSPTAKIAIIAGACGAFALILCAGLFYFFRQRRRGARENALAMQRAEAERRENEGFKAAGINPDGFTEVAPEYGQSQPQSRNPGFLNTGNSYSAVPNAPVSPVSPNEKGFPSAPARSFSNGPPGHSNEYHNGWR